MDLRSPAGIHDKGALNLPPISTNFDPPRPLDASKRHSLQPLPLAAAANTSIATSAVTSAAEAGLLLQLDATKMHSLQSTPHADTDKTSGGLHDSEQLIQSSSQPISYAAKVRPTIIKKPDFPAYGLRTLHSKREGEVVTLSIPKSEYQQRLDEFQFALIGRMILRKGDKPRSFTDITLELQRIWQCSDCQFIPMAKGFFTIKFNTLEAKKKAKGNAILQLSTGHIRLREWCRYFDPYKETSSLAQVWVRVYYLPVELWTPVIIANIGRALGHPLRIDNVSANGQVGHFARVLVEINMALPLLNSMYIDDGNNSFYIEFGFESLPLFCSRCKITGHSTDKCRRVAKANGKQKNEEAADQVEENHERATTVDPKPAWQPKEQVNEPNVKDSDLQPIGLEKRYGVFHKDDEKVAETNSDRVDENFVVESPDMSLNDVVPNSSSGIPTAAITTSASQEEPGIDRTPESGASIVPLHDDSTHATVPLDQVRPASDSTVELTEAPTAKRGRGRPKGATKQVGKGGISNTSIKQRLRHPASISTPGDAAGLAMTAVSSQRWGDIMDSDIQPVYPQRWGDIMDSDIQPVYPQRWGDIMDSYIHTEDDALEF